MKHEEKSHAVNIFAMQMNHEEKDITVGSQSTNQSMVKAYCKAVSMIGYPKCMQLRFNVKIIITTDCSTLY